MKNVQKHVALLVLLLLSRLGAGQGHQVEFQLNTATFRSVIPHFADSAKKALRIESEILSSQEFKDSLVARTFDCRSNPASACDCSQNDLGCTTRIPGTVVYESLTKARVVTMTLVIKKANPWTRFVSESYGKSCPCTSLTTTYRWWLHNDTLMLTQHYAAHLAHEYTHIAGYLHGDFALTDDAPYVVGNIVERILLRRKKAGMITAGGW
jgi:hypothetical protein